MTKDQIQWIMARNNMERNVKDGKPTDAETCQGVLHLIRFIEMSWHEDTTRFQVLVQEQSNELCTALGNNPGLIQESTTRIKNGVAKRLNQPQQ